MQKSLLFILLGCMVFAFVIVLDSQQTQNKEDEEEDVKSKENFLRIFESNPKCAVCQLVIGQMEQMMSYLNPLIKSHSVYQHSKESGIMEAINVLTDPVYYQRTLKFPPPVWREAVLFLDRYNEEIEELFYKNDTMENKKLYFCALKTKSCPVRYQNGTATTSQSVNVSSSEEKSSEKNRNENE